MLTVIICAEKTQWEVLKYRTLMYVRLRVRCVTMFSDYQSIL